MSFEVAKLVRESLDEYLPDPAETDVSGTTVLTRPSDYSGPTTSPSRPPGKLEPPTSSKLLQGSFRIPPRIELRDADLSPPSITTPAPITSIDELLAGKPICTLCGLDDMVRKRDDYTTKSGEIRKYWSCDRCRSRIRVNVTGRRNSPWVVGDVLSRFYGGASILDIEAALPEVGVNLGASAILDYVASYPYLIARFLHWVLEKYGLPHIGNIWQVDEKPVPSLGSNYWILTVMDQATEFVLVLKLIRGRTVDNLEDSLREARRLARKCPLILETDALAGYPEGIRRALNGATHWRVKKSEWYGVNNLVENFNSRLEAWLRPKKGLHELNTAQNLLHGIWTQKMFVRKSTSQYLLNQSPAQAAGFSINLERPFTDLLTLAEKAALLGHIKFLRPAKQRHLGQRLQSSSQTRPSSPKMKQQL